MKYVFFFLILFSSFLFSQNCNIGITSPSLHDTWLVGRTYNITWQSYGECPATIDKIKLFGSYGEISTLVDQILNVPNNGSTSYNVPLSVYGYPYYYLEFAINYLGDEITVGYSSSFYIAMPQCWVEVLSPSYGDVWYVGSTYSILWQYGQDCPSRINIKLYGENISGAQVIDTILNVSNTGSYSYTVPQHVYGYEKYFFEFVVVIDGEEFSAGTSPYFYINQAPCEIAITKPSYNETWYAGSTYNIEWYYTGICPENISYILLFGSKPTGEFLLDQISNVPNNGIHPYTPSNAILGYDYYYFVFQIYVNGDLVDIARSRNFYIREREENYFSVFPRVLKFLVKKNSTAKDVFYIIPNVESVNFEISSNQNWISTNPSSGTANYIDGSYKIEVTVSAEGLNEGSYTGEITVSSQSRAFSLNVLVYMEVVPISDKRPVFSIEPEKIAFNYKLGEDPQPELFILKNNGDGKGYFIVEEASEFLSIEPFEGSLEAGEVWEISVDVIKNFETVGTRKGFVKIKDQFGSSVELICHVNVYEDYYSSKWDRSNIPTITLPIAATGLGGAYGSYWSTDIFTVLKSKRFFENLKYGIQSNFSPRDRANFVFGAIGKKSRAQDAIVTEFQIGDDFPSGFSDFLGNFMGIEGASCFIQMRGELAQKVAIFSRTYTTANDGSTYGQFIGAPSEDQIIGNQGGKEIVFGLRNDENFRSNVFITEIDGIETNVEVRLYTHTGQVTGNVLSKKLEGFSQWQIIDIFSKTGSSANWAYAEIKSYGGGKIYAFGSVVDRKTNDPITLPGLIPKDEAKYGNLYFPAVVKASGAYGTNWRTDLVFMNSSDKAMNIEVELYSRDGKTKEVKNVTILPQNMGIYLDALNTLFEKEEGFGSLILKNVDLSKLFLFGRIYNLKEDGSTYGQGYIAFKENETTKLNDDPLFGMGIEASSSFRTNAGIFEVSGNPAKVLFTLIFPDGQSRNFVKAINPNEWIQIDNIVKTKGGYDMDVSNAWIVVSVIEGSGKIVGYLSIVDNKSSDATFVKLLKP